VSLPIKVKRVYRNPLGTALIKHILEPLFDVEPFVGKMVTDPTPDIASCANDNPQCRKVLALRLKWWDKLNVWLSGEDEATTKLRKSMLNCKLNGAGFEVDDPRGSKFCHHWMLCPWCRMRVAMHDGKRLIDVYDSKLHTLGSFNNDVFPATSTTLIYACGGVSGMLRYIHAQWRHSHVAGLWVVTPTVRMEANGTRMRGWRSSLITIRERRSEDKAQTDDALPEAIGSAFSFNPLLWSGNRLEFKAFRSDSSGVRMRCCYTV